MRLSPLLAIASVLLVLFLTYAPEKGFAEVKVNHYGYASDGYDYSGATQSDPSVGNAESPRSKFRKLADNILSNIQSRFVKFLSTFKRSYSPQEFQRRLGVFRGNVARMLSHNSDPRSRYKLDVNPFADMTYEEFSRTFLMAPRMNDADEHSQSAMDIDELVQQGMVQALDVDLLPPSYDNRAIATEPILYQGACGSCWTFAAAYTFQASRMMNNMPTPGLSQQQILECSGNASPCMGGHVSAAYRYGNDVGLVSAEAYPYTGTSGPCKNQIVEQNTKYTGGKVYRISPQSRFLIDQIKFWITSGGVSATVDAQSNFYLYKEGVFDGEPGCSQTVSNHAINLVGYGTSSDGQQYWIMRNSWGTMWGENGYMRIAAGQMVCAIESSVTALVFDEAADRRRPPPSGGFAVPPPVQPTVAPRPSQNVTPPPVKAPRGGLFSFLKRK